MLEGAERARDDVGTPGREQALPIPEHALPAHHLEYLGWLILACLLRGDLKLRNGVV
jgi:hypothetical protein